MRGLAKPWPPDNVSPDGQDVRSFSDAERRYLAELAATDAGTGFARASFDGLDKSKLRAVMYREQRHLCVYCERRIEEGHPADRIDHWRPLSDNHDLALHWENLYLSCPSTDSCDRAKGDRPLKWDEADPDLPWPTDQRYEDLVGFTSRGEMYVRTDVNIPDARRKALQLAIDDQQDGDRVRKAILNLNTPALVAARAAAIDSMKTRLGKQFKGKTASRADREQMADDLLLGEKLPPFVSIRVGYLRKTLGKGR